MTQVWPVFGEAPVPGWVSMIFSPEGVVMTGWAFTVANVMGKAASASKAVRRGSFRGVAEAVMTSFLFVPRLACRVMNVQYLDNVFVHAIKNFVWIATERCNADARTV